MAESARLLALIMPSKGLFAVRAALDMAVANPAAILLITETFLASHRLAVRGSAALPTAVFMLLAKAVMSSCNAPAVPAHTPNASARAIAAASGASALLTQAGSTAAPFASAKESHLRTWRATPAIAFHLAAVHGLVT